MAVASKKAEVEGVETFVPSASSEEYGVSWANLPCRGCGSIERRQAQHMPTQYQIGDLEHAWSIDEYCAWCSMHLVYEITLPEDEEPPKEATVIFYKTRYEETEHRTAQMWDFEYGLPVPKFQITCECGHTERQAQAWRFFYRYAAGWPYRCDFHWKCVWCGSVAAHGIWIPEELFLKHAYLEVEDEVKYSWRAGKEYLESRGYGE